jgi:peptidylprolyl isomerase
MEVDQNPWLFLDVAINGVYAGRITIEAYHDTVPRTAENFRCLCTGERGIGESGRLLHYKGCKFHRVVKDFICQGGDFTRHNGSGGESIYGRAFEDESFSGKAARHLKYSVVMASSGPNTNNSQFYITMRETPWLDGKGVVFGEVVGGEEVLEAMNAVGTKLGNTTRPVVIVDCGQCANENYGAPGLWGSSGPRGHETMHERDIDNRKRWEHKMAMEKEKAQRDIVRSIGAEGMNLHAGADDLHEKLKEEHGLEVAHAIVRRGSSHLTTEVAVSGAQAKDGDGSKSEDGKKSDSDGAVVKEGEAGAKAEAKDGDFEAFLANEAKAQEKKGDGGQAEDAKVSKDLRPESAATAKSEAETEGGEEGEGEGGGEEGEEGEEGEGEEGHTEDEHDDNASRDDASRDDDHHDDEDEHDDDHHEEEEHEEEHHDEEEEHEEEEHEEEEHHDEEEEHEEEEHEEEEHHEDDDVLDDEDDV